VPGLAASSHGGLLRHPYGFSRGYYSELAQLSGDERAKALLRSHETDLQLIETDDAGIVNQIRLIDAPEELRIVQRALAEARVLIADGHHRYETALVHRRRMRAAVNHPGTTMPYDYVMMTLVAFNDPGLVILPTHRLIRRLDRDAMMSFAARARELFDIEEFKNGDAMRAALSAGVIVLILVASLQSGGIRPAESPTGRLRWPPGTG